MLTDTGNMKFTMNGALTIGACDGANVEIRRVVGAENFFRFGQTVEQVEQTWRTGHRPREIAAGNEALRTVVELLDSGLFAHGDRELFWPLVDLLLEHDPFLVCADFQDCADDQARVDPAWRESDRWTRMAMLNVTRCGRFSSDRAAREYDDDIWSPPAAAVAAAAP